MFGQNPIAKKRIDPLDLWRVNPMQHTYQVQEVFPTIQGEGPLTGTPALFVRLAHCCLACLFCDTDFTSSKWEPTLEDLMADIKSKMGASRCVVITGGEPMMQEIGPLCCAIVDQLQVPVQIETAGVMWPDSFDVDQPAFHWDLPVLLQQDRVSIVCSPKTGKVLPKVAAHCWHWKYIISAHEDQDPNDGLPIMSTQRKETQLRLFRPDMHAYPTPTIWVQPAEEYFVPFVHTLNNGTFTAGTEITRPLPDPVGSKASMKRAVDIALKHGYRLSLQTHKIIDLP